MDVLHVRTRKVISLLKYVGTNQTIKIHKCLSQFIKPQQLEQIKQNEKIYIFNEK